MFLYAGEYDTVEDAKADLEELKELHREHFVGTYDDAAVLTKRLFGKVHAPLASRLSIRRIMATSMKVSLVCTRRS